jgi:hypothetical protein
MNPRILFHEPLPDHTEVSFVPMAAVEEESGRLDASQTQTLGSVRKGYTLQTVRILPPGSRKTRIPKRAGEGNGTTAGMDKGIWSQVIRGIDSAPPVCAFFTIGHRRRLICIGLRRLPSSVCVSAVCSMESACPQNMRRIYEQRIRNKD